jgi:hypothetical protein
MTRTLADILRDALDDADLRGIRSPSLDRLSNSDVQMLAELCVPAHPSVERVPDPWLAPGGEFRGRGDPVVEPADRLPDLE